jgi:hypothetical protein
MGLPAAPGAHQENQEAARSTAVCGELLMVAAQQQQMWKGHNPMEHIPDFFSIRK